MPCDAMRCEEGRTRVGLMRMMRKEVVLMEDTCTIRENSIKVGSDPGGSHGCLHSPPLPVVSPLY